MARSCRGTVAFEREPCRRRHGHVGDVTGGGLRGGCLHLSYRVSAAALSFVVEFGRQGAHGPGVRGLIRGTGIKELLNVLRRSERRIRDRMPAGWLAVRLVCSELCTRWP
jgi:hypothetical protein